MELSSNVSALFGGVRVTTNSEGASRQVRPNVETVAAAAQVTNMLLSVGEEVECVALNVTRGENGKTDAWIHFPNGMELTVRESKEGRRKDYSVLLGFGSQHGTNKEATMNAAQILQDSGYEVIWPGNGTKELKGYVRYNYTNSRGSMSTLLDVTTALELAAEEVAQSMAV